MTPLRSWVMTGGGIFSFRSSLIWFCTVTVHCDLSVQTYMDRVKPIWCLSPMRAAKVQASLRIRAVSPEPPLLAQTSSESRGTFRQKARSLAPLNDWACAVKICHDGMLEDTNSLDGAHMTIALFFTMAERIQIYRRDSADKGLDGEYHTIHQLVLLQIVKQNVIPYNNFYSCK